MQDRRRRSQPIFALVLPDSCARANFALEYLALGPEKPV
jgi:hypothetical protein